jgi:hypothetical protein
MLPSIHRPFKVAFRILHHDFCLAVLGIQSLISVYLVALAILTYFGTPFEWSPQT